MVELKGTRSPIVEIRNKSKLSILGENRTGRNTFADLLRSEAGNMVELKGTRWTIVENGIKSKLSIPGEMG